MPTCKTFVLQIAFFDDNDHNSGRLTSALSTDANYIRGAAGDAVALTLQNFSCLAAGYVIALIYDWRMALLVTGSFPIFVTVRYLQLKCLCI